MLRVYVVRRGLVAVFSRLHRWLLVGELWHLCQPCQHVAQVRVGQDVLTKLEQVAQVVHGWRYAVDEVLLMLEISAETIGSKHLHGAEEHEQREPLGEMPDGWHLHILLQRVVVFRY